MKSENKIRSTNHWLVFSVFACQRAKNIYRGRRALGHEIREFQTEHSAPLSFVRTADDKFPPSFAFQ
jgi:hypothetical protein